MLEMLDEYSRGKVLTIQTQQKRKKKKANKKKNKKLNHGEEVEEFAEVDFSDPESESENEENVERAFNFVNELCRLVDYDVIDKYLFILKSPQIYAQRPVVIKACTSFFKRVVSQTKQTWIFFQLETLSIFNDFLQKDITNNSLMRGIFEKKPNTKNQRVLEANSAELKVVITSIVGCFTELLKKNPMAGVEILFRFDSRETKDQILNNYEVGRREQTQKPVYKDNRIQEEVIDLNNFGAGELNINNLRLDEDEEQKSHQDEEGEAGHFNWTPELDEILINNYGNFIGLGKRGCFEMISMLIPDTTGRMCYERGKKLGVKKLSIEECRARS